MVTIVEDKRVSPGEYAALMASVGWGDESAYDAAAVGYVRAFSDTAFSVFIGELVVHPTLQRRGIGARLLRAVESHYAGVPVYVKSFVAQASFFERNGYSLPARSMTLLSKRNLRPG
jgi:GNAT superfamily N-acetyltransferase